MTEFVESLLSRPRLRQMLASALVGIALLCSGAALLEIFGRTYAVELWLIARYARAWLWAAVFGLSALSIGNLLVVWLSRPGERTEGQFTLGFASGVFVFFLAIFLAGIAGKLHQATFFAIPALLFGLGARRLFRDVRERLERIRDGSIRLELTWWEGLALAAGAIGLAVVFLPTLVPENVAYDARWYHLPLAEEYVLQGGIRRFPEGWVPSAMPHLASLLYAWTFLAPGADLFDRIITAAQLEYLIFLATLPGIPLLVRSVVPGVRANLSWVWAFTFPALFIYDTGLSVAADHICALFAIPAYVAMQRALRELAPRACALLVIQLAALALSKYTALVAIAFPVLAIAVRMAWLCWLRIRGRVRNHNWLWGPLSALVLGLAITSPHWLKNWLWYGDPLYPILHQHFASRPWIPDGALIYQVFLNEAFAALGSWQDKTLGGLYALYDHSFGLYTWEVFHGRFAVMGSLFTFILVALPFVKAPLRLWGLILATHLGIFIWYVRFHEDRYLQTIFPWMVAATAAIAALAWRRGPLARVGVLSLTAIQLVGGTEAMFWPTHQMTGRSGLSLANDFFAQTMRKNFGPRVRPYEDMAAIGKDLPKGSKVLMHRDHLRLGIGVSVVADAYRSQYGLSYGYIGSSSALYRVLKSYGVTHVLWTPEQTYGEQSLAAELVFHAFVARHLKNPQYRGGRRLAELSPEPPTEEGSTVFVFGCDPNLYKSGLYEMSQLTRSPLVLPGKQQPPLATPRVPLEGDPAPLMARASHAAIQTGCPDAPKTPDFERIARWGGSELLLRKTH